MDHYSVSFLNQILLLPIKLCIVSMMGVPYRKVFGILLNIHLLSVQFMNWIDAQASDF